MSRPPQNRARRSSVALGRQSGPVGRTAVPFVFIRRPVGPLALSLTSRLSSVRRKPRNGNDARALSLSPPVCVSPVFISFFLFIKGDVTVSSLPPRYVTDITGHRSVYPASSTYLSPFPWLYPVGSAPIPLTLYPKRPPIYLPYTPPLSSISSPPSPSLCPSPPDRSLSSAPWKKRKTNRLVNTHTTTRRKRRGGHEGLVEKRAWRKHGVPAPRSRRAIW